MSEPNQSSFRTVRLELAKEPYDIIVGHGLSSSIGPLLLNQPDLQFPFVIITDDQVKAVSVSANLLVESFLSLEKPTAKEVTPSKIISVLPGEASKSVEQVGVLLSRLAKLKIPRSGTVIAFGGGVIGDLAGFVAATYLRGINFVQVPTTLLAMVDSSVGGKTGVNLPEGKNLVGAFHQPKLVIADLDTLATLPPREFAAGMAEVIKYGAIRDAALFQRVMKGVKPDDKDLDEIVEKCVSIKARIVENDEFETKGERALLNFGHTIGHAIEKAAGYKTYLHGEAISLGMRAAAWLSREVSGLSQEDARDIDLALINNQLPVVLKPEVESQAILGALGNDKKVAADGGNRWVVLSEIGKSESGKIISLELVVRAVEYLRTHPDDL